MWLEKQTIVFEDGLATVPAPVPPQKAHSSTLRERDPSKAKTDTTDMDVLDVDALLEKMQHILNIPKLETQSKTGAKVVQLKPQL